MARLDQTSRSRTKKSTLATGILGLLRRPDEFPDFRRLPLGLESLESRSLMAVAAMGSDMQSTLPPDEAAFAAFQSQAVPRGPLHNTVDPEDVDNDGDCTASDV